MCRRVRIDFAAAVIDLVILFVAALPVAPSRACLTTRAIARMIRAVFAGFEFNRLFDGAQHERASS